MTPEESLNQFNSTNPFMHGSDKQEEYFNVIRQALEKQIPETPLPYKGWEGKCPNCGVIFLDRSTNYCGNCGQALDWGETE